MQRLKTRFSKAKTFVIRNRRHIPAAALLFGLFWDWLTLGRPDKLFDNVVLLFYIFVAGTGILMLARRRQKEQPTSIALIAVVQFSFGNLTSGLFILYNISGTLAGAWPFLLLLVALLVGNELLRSRYGFLRFTVAVYYLLLFAYFALIIPVLLKDIGTGVFLLAGVASIAAIALFLQLIRWNAPNVFREHWYQMTIAIGSIFVGFVLLYVLNLVPPVPLATKEIGIYHNVERLGNDGDYIVTYEKGEWYEFWKRSDATFRRRGAEPAYCFSAIFAPAGIETTIFHSWEHFNEESGRWEVSSRIALPLSGGRDEGFRGFSTKQALAAGKWRCDAETQRGTLIGRRTFTIEATDEPLELVTDIR